MKSSTIRLLSLMMTIAMMVSFVLVPSASAAVAGATGKTGAQDDSAQIGQYADYLASIAGKSNAKESITIDPTKYEVVDNSTVYNVVDEEGNVVEAEKSVLSTKEYAVLSDLINGDRETVNCLVWGDNNKFQQQGKVKYTFTVPADGIYNLCFTYKPLDKTGGDDIETNDKTSTTAIEIGVSIDGKIPYAGLDALKLSRKFVNRDATLQNPVGNIREDSLGNQLTPDQVQYDEFISQYAVDPVGVVAEPYCIFLEAGEHTIEIESVYEPFALAKIEFTVPETVPSYDAYIKATKAAGAVNYTGETLSLQGEDAWLKSTNALVAKADNSSCDVTPNDHIKTKLNYIGSTNWQTPGESITWVVNVPTDGYYKLGIHYKQSAIIDGMTYRSLSIDGSIPFEECKSIAFDYCTSWTFYEFGTGGKGGAPYLFYLEAGTHTMELKVTLGETSEFYTRLNEIVEVIGDTYLDIVMITSDSPDPNRDYDLFNQIPGFQETLYGVYTKLDKLAGDMSALSGDRSNKYISALQNMSRVVKNMYDNPYTAQNYLSDFYSNYTTVCSWLYEMKTMPLSIDEFQFAAPDGEFIDKHANFFEAIVFEAKRFAVSFTKAFSTIGGTVGQNGQETVRIWVNWGRDQAQVLSNLIQDSFTAQTGIGVQLEIVDASLIKGILSGNFPDLQLHLSRTDPVNLGMRGALYDLTNFSHKIDEKYSTVDDGKNFLLDYETVIGYYDDNGEWVPGRFQESADTPYWYNNPNNGKKELYALPDTQGFFIMFFRTDVFDDLGLEYPTEANGGMGWTWDDFLDATTVLQRKNMKSYIPYVKIASTTTVNAGMGSLNLFGTMITQNNVQLYNDTNNGTNLTTAEAIEAFADWTDLYTKYGIEKQADFYNRFRIGSMPLGIASYTTYTQLTQAAPEIQGRWTIAPIPGVPTYNEDGSIASINRSIAGSGTGCGVVKVSEKKDLAWQFLCWWTSADTQLRYNNNVESILGAVARTATANVEAFNAYSWNANDLEILNAQWQEVEELPELPGGYYVARAIDQAYWEVLNGEENEKDALLEWGKVADNEIKRKIAEYTD